MTDKALDKREHGHGPEEQSYIRNTLDSLQGLYCPCTGFAYNSLVGDRNLFVRSSTSLSSRADQKCKHLLAVLLANQMGRAYKMEVAMHNVAGLLDLAKAAEVKPAEAVKVERVDEDMETDA
jgi:predicted nucleic acid-binding Zn finger protein